MLTALLVLERILMPNPADLNSISTENVTPSHVVAAFGDGVLTLSALKATGSGRPLQIDIIDASSYISQPPALKANLLTIGEFPLVRWAAAAARSHPFYDSDFSHTTEWVVALQFCRVAGS